MTKSCKWCGLHFEATGKQKLCSSECSALLSSFSKTDEYSPFRDMLASAKRRSAKAGKICTLTLQDVKNLWLKQDGCCAYTGEKLSLGGLRSVRRLRGYTTASLDRIDSVGSYTVENVQIVHVAINFMKHELSHDDFLLWCRKVVDNLSWLKSLTDYHGVV